MLFRQSYVNIYKFVLYCAFIAREGSVAASIYYLYLKVSFVDAEEAWELVLRWGDVRPQFLQQESVMVHTNSL